MILSPLKLCFSSAARFAASFLPVLLRCLELSVYGAKSKLGRHTGRIGSGEAADARSSLLSATQPIHGVYASRTFRRVFNWEEGISRTRNDAGSRRKYWGLLHCYRVWRCFKLWLGWNAGVPAGPCLPSQTLHNKQTGFVSDDGPAAAVPLVMRQQSGSDSLHHFLDIPRAMNLNTSPAH
jgi:hypothetical protein